MAGRMFWRPRTETAAGQGGLGFGPDGLARAAAGFGLAFMHARERIPVLYAALLVLMAAAGIFGTSGR